MVAGDEVRGSAKTSASLSDAWLENWNRLEKVRVVS